MLNKRVFQFIFPIFLFVFGCTKVPDDIDVTVDTAQNGMIQGEVFIPVVENSYIRWIGFKGATITLANTEYSVTSLQDGVYAIDGIETGSYNVKATAPDYRSDTKAVVVSRQSTSTVPDLKLNPGFNTVIMHGKIYLEDKTTPFANQTIKLYRAGHNLSTDEWVPSTFVSSTITTANGEFAFQETSYDHYMLYYNSEYDIKWMNPESPITGSLTASGGIVQRDAYIK